MKEARKQMDRNTGVNYKADSGAVVVMEARTGRVVAMASNPTYDPNAWVGGISGKDYARLTGKKSNYPLLNRAIQGQSAPGSIFKVVPTAAAVNAGYPFDGNYECSSSYSIGGQVFKNFESKGYGPISLGRALEVSCDTVFYRLSHEEWKRDGGTKPKKNAERLVLQDRPPVRPRRRDRHRPAQRGHRPHPRPPVEAGATGRPTRTPGARPARRTATTPSSIAYENCLEGNRMRAGDSVNYSIGQGDTLVTPIQMATIYAAISNGGTLYDPTVGKAIISADGKHVAGDRAQGARQAADDEEDPRRDRRSPRGSRHPRYGRLAVQRLAAGQDPDARQDGYRRGLRQADHLVVRHLHQGLLDRHDDLPGWYGLRCLRPRPSASIYNALYGVSEDGKIDKRKALLPTPQKSLPKIQPDGSIDAPKIEAYPPPQEEQATEEGGLAVPTDTPAATVPSPGTGDNRDTRRRTARPKKRRRVDV